MFKAIKTSVLLALLGILWQTAFCQTAFGQKPELFIQTGHSEFVDAIAVSPDGRMMATGSKDKTVRLWDLTNRQEVRVLLGHEEWIDAVAFSPDGKMLASGGFDETIRLWDVTSGKQLRKIVGHTQFVREIAFSPDGKSLASIGGDEDNSIRVWDAASGKQLYQLKVSANADENKYIVTAFVFRPDGKMLVSAETHKGGVNKIRFWDLTTGRQISENPTPNGETVNSLAVAPDGRGLLARKSEGIFSPDGTRFFEAADKSVNIYDAVQKRLVKHFKLDEGKAGSKISDITFAPDGTSVFAARGTSVLQWSVGDAVNETAPAPDFEFAGRVAPVTAFDVNPNGKSLVLGNNEGLVYFWDVLTEQPPRSLPRYQIYDSFTGNTVEENRVNVFSLDYGGDGKTLVAGLDTIVSFDLSNPAAVPRRLIEDNYDADEGARTIVMSPSRDVFAYNDGDKTVRLRDVRTGKELHALDAECENCGWSNSLSFSPNGQLLAATNGYISSDETGLNSREFVEIVVWNAATGKQITKITDSFETVKDGQTLASGKDLKDARFSPDSATIAALDNNGDVRFWNLAAKKEIPAPAKIPAWAAFEKWRALGEKGEFQILLDGTSVLLRDAANRKELARLIAVGANDWLVVTPEGFFDGSPAAWSALKWRFNNDTLNYGAVELYFNEFFQPGLLEDIVNGKSPKPKAGRELEKIDRRQPTVEIVSINGQSKSQPNAQTANGRQTAAVIIEVADNASAKKQTNHDATSGAQDLRLFRNGSLVKVWHDDLFDKANGCEAVQIKEGEPRRVRCSADVAVTAGDNNFTAYAFNSANVKSNDAAAAVKSGLPKRDGTLYVLAVGVNKYANADYDLRFAVPDVLDIGTAIKTAQDKLQTDAKPKQYNETKVINLTDAAATKENILLALNRFTKDGAKTILPENLCAKLTGEGCAELKIELGKIKATEPEDALLVYYAGHGTSRGQRFYLLPHDFTGAGGEQSLGAQGVSDVEINDALEKVDAGKLLMTIDACESGTALGGEKEGRGPMNSKGLAQLAYDKGMLILTATQSADAAKEAAEINGVPINHGLLTYALLEGLRNLRADADGDKKLTEREWLDYTTGQVPLLQLEAMKQRHIEIKRGLQPDARNRSEIVYLAGDDPNADPAKRNVQTPRVFYRRETETNPLIIGR